MFAGLLGSGMLTIAGLTVAYWIVLPMAFPMLRNLVPQGVAVNLRYETYVDVVFKFLIAFAAGFQFPVVVVSLVHLGVVPVRFFLKNTKYVLVIILIVSAVLTPGPDAFSQLMMAIPLFGLYILSMGVAYIFRKREA